MNMRSQAELHEAANIQVPGGDLIPFSTHIADNVIRNRANGELLATWRIDGIAFETADREFIRQRKEGLVNFYRALGGGSWAVWTHKVRRVVHERLDGEYTIPFCQELADAYYSRLDDVKQMATELYITVVYRPPRTRGWSIFRRNPRSESEIQAVLDEDLSVMDDMAKQVESSLSKYGVERLGTHQKGGVVFSQMLTFFGFLVNGVWEDIPLQRAKIADYLPTSRLNFGDNNGMLEIWHPKASKYAGFMDIKEYPQFSEPGMNNGILYGDYEYIETQSFSIKNKRDARSSLIQQKGQLHAGGEASPSEIKEMDVAVDELQRGVIELGEYHYSLAVFGSDLADVAKNVAHARTALTDDAGLQMAIVDVVPEGAWYAQLPGNWWLRPREADITSRNFASLCPFHNFAAGKKQGNPWGEALILLPTPSKQPFYANLHASPEEHDSTDQKYPGNTFICGVTGSGKTTLAMALSGLATKFRGLRIVFFDKDRGMEIAIRFMGGKYTTLRRGRPTGFNPCQMPINERNIALTEKLVTMLVGGARTTKEENDISNAVRTVMSAQVAFDVRRLGTVAQGLPSVGDDSLRNRLKKWIAPGPLAWVFDNPKDTLDFTGNTLFGFDYTEFLDDPEVCTPIMTYLLHLTETLIDGNPFIYYMTEFWKPIGNPQFKDLARNKLKTIRKENGLGMFDTQSPSDVLGTDIGKTVVEQCVTKIFLPNPAADYDDYVKGFKVTEAEFEIIRNLGDTSRMLLIKQGHQSAVVKFDLSGMSEILDVISGSTDNVELLDQIMNEYGEDPAVIRPIFHERISQRRKLARS